MRPGARWLAALPLCLALIVAGVAPARADTLGVTLTSPAEGSFVGGNVPVAASTTGTPISVAFDWSSNGGATWTPIGTDLDGSNGWTGLWATGSFSGPAVVRATASDGVSTAQDTSMVTVDNLGTTVSLTVAPTPFSPNGDGNKDQTTLTATVAGPATVVIRVLRTTGVELRRWTVSTSGSPVAVTWGGRYHGHVLKDGLYAADATATDSFGFDATDGATLRIDTKAPRITWRSIDPEPVSDQSSMGFAFTTSDRSDTEVLNLHLVDRVDKEVGSRLSLTKDTGDASISWKPRDPQGRVLYPGRYRALLKARDDAGNIAHSSKPWRVHRSMTASVYTRLDGAGNRVALTFDDCYDATAWADILDILKSKNVNATFFCTGVYVDAFPTIAKRVYHEGHVAGNHTYDHTDLTTLSESAAETELRDDRHAWWTSASDTPAPYCRPPYGAYDSDVITACGNTSHPRLILWDVDPQDYANSTSTIISSVLGATRAGSIVLMHALPQTADALPAIIDGLRGDGLKMVTLLRLFRAAGKR